MTKPAVSEAAQSHHEPSPRGLLRVVQNLQRFRSLFAAGGAVLAISMISHFRVPLLPSIGRDLQLSAFELGLITTAFAAGRLVFDIPTGRFADRWSSSRMFAAAAAALGLGSFLFAAAPNGTVTLLAGFMLGVSTAIANTTGMTVFSSSVSARYRGSAMAAFSASLLGGQALGPSVGGVVGTLAGWRAAQVVAGVVAFAGFTALILRLRLQPDAADTVSRSRAEAEAQTLDAPEPPGIGTPQRVVLYSVPFVMFFTLGAMPQTLVPIIGDRAYGLSAAIIGLALGLGGVSRFVGAIVGGFISDRVSRKAALVPGLGLMSVGVALLALDVGVWAWVAAIVIMSLASFGVSVAATMLADYAGGQQVGRRLGPFRFVGDLGLVVGPTLATATFSTFGRQWAVLGVSSLLVMCTVLCATSLRETRRARDDVLGD